MTISQDGYSLRLYPSNLFEQLWEDCTWREVELLLIRADLPIGDQMIDVGANVGHTALIAGADGRVCAIKPHPPAYSFLRGNLALSGAKNIIALNAGRAIEPAASASAKIAGTT